MTHRILQFTLALALFSCSKQAAGDPDPVKPPAVIVMEKPPPPVGNPPDPTAPAPVPSLRLAWDYPSKGKVTAPECAAESTTFLHAHSLPPVLHQHETAYLVVKEAGDVLQVSRYEGTVLQARRIIREEGIFLITPDGFTVAMSTQDLSDLGQEGTLIRLPVASAALSLSRWADPLLSLVPSLAGPRRMAPFLMTGLPHSHAMTLAIYDPALLRVGSRVRIGDICVATNCEGYRPFFFQGDEDVLHVVWVPATIGMKFKWKYVIRSFSLKTGKSLGPARDLLQSEVYASSPVGDRIREAIENPIVEWNVRFPSVLYEKREVLAKTTFRLPGIDQTLEAEKPGDILFGSIRMEVTSPTGRRTVEVIDEDLKEQVRPLFTTEIRMMEVKDYQLERRPGSGFFVVMSLSAIQEKWLSHFYREYTADGTPDGPVRKVDFSRITRLSDRAWRAQSACSWEVRSRTQ